MESGSYQFNAGQGFHAPAYESNSSGRQSDVLVGIGQLAFFAVVTRFVQFDRGHDTEIRSADQEIDAFPTDLVEPGLPQRAFVNSDDLRNLDLRQNDVVGDCLGHPVVKRLLDVGQWRFSEEERQSGRCSDRCSSALNEYEECRLDKQKRSDDQNDFKCDRHGRLPRHVDDVEFTSYQGHAALLFSKSTKNRRGER